MVFVFPPVNANVTITGGATEATLLLIETNTENTTTELQTLNAVDFATEAKQDSQIVEAQSSNTKLDAVNTSLDNIEADMDQLNARLGGSLAPVAYDEVVLTYVGATTAISTVVYKLATATVKTLTLGYDGSDRLTSVVAT